MQKNAVDTLDTAIAYGESERVLGQIGVDGYQIITKLLTFDNEKDVLKSVERQINRSLENLKQKELYGLLLHGSNALEGKR